MTKNAEHNSIRCEICFEPFHVRERLPKLLPCEHNFCEQCILSLCCHQQVTNHLLNIITFTCFEVIKLFLVKFSDVEKLWL